MSDELQGPDFSNEISTDELEEITLGHFDGKQVVVVETDSGFYAVDAECTHYGGPLQDGAVANGQIRCPWHHASFDLETGRASGPALKDVGCYELVHEGDAVRITGQKVHEPTALSDPPSRIGIVGAGAAGAACAETLRKLGFEGQIFMLTRGLTVPVDRPNLSKDYLSGDAPSAWLPLRRESFYRENDIDLINDQVIRLDTEEGEVTTQTGHTYGFDRLLIATGAEPRRLDVPGCNLGHVHTLRSVQDADAIIERAKASERAIVIGASFIGLEVAASLRARDIEVSVIDPAEVPMAHVFGEELGAWFQKNHEDNGVEFHLGRKPAKIDEGSVTLDDGTVVEGDFIVVGIGVEPRITLAENAGIECNDGIVVNRRLESSAEGVYAAGDVARFPYEGESVRIEHFALAERHGQFVAASMLGLEDSFDDVPFFWTRQYGTSVAYVGHAGDFDEVEVHGSIEDGDAAVVYLTDGAIKAVATINRPDLSLMAEIAFEDDEPARIKEAFASS